MLASYLSDMNQNVASFRSFYLDVFQLLEIIHAFFPPSHTATDASLFNPVF